MNDHKLCNARMYEARESQKISPEERPAYHFSCQVGWMNDPNGFSVYNGKYHLFYQYYPYANAWGPMHWGHAVSQDLIHWDYLPAALAPEDSFDYHGCFSGSAVETPEGKQLLLYTGVTEVEDPQGNYTLQSQCIALGDGVDYTKYPANPVLDGKDIPDGFSPRDFRDPKIWLEPDGSYAAVAVNRTEDGSGAVLLLRSPDGFRWRVDAILDRCRNEYGRMWECPDFFPLNGKQVLMVSPQEMAPKGLEFHEGDNTMVILGSYEDKTFRREAVQQIDYGMDFYAPQTTLALDGRRILIAWMQAWRTSKFHTDARGYYGSFTIPRELQIRDGRLIQTPVRELEARRRNRVLYQNDTFTGMHTLENIQGRIADITVELTPAESGYRNFHIRVACGKDTYTEISYDPESSILRLSREHAAIRPEDIQVRECYVRNRSGALKLRLLLDRFSVEVFANDGEQTMTSLIYDPAEANGISFCAEGSVNLWVEKFDLQ